MSRTGRRTVVMAVVLAVVGGACTGGDDVGTASTGAGGGSTTTAVPSTTSASSTTAAPSTTTTTGPQPEPAPAGVWWSEGIDLDVHSSWDNEVRGLEVVGGDLWAFGKVANGSFLQRSGDGGRTWSAVEVEPPPAHGTYGLEGILERPGGGYVAWGRLGSRCDTSEDAGDGYRWVGICRRYRPIVHVSDDGATWRRVEAPSPPGDTELEVAGVVRFGGGLLMAATVKGPDWHVRIYESASGETWDLARELRADRPMSTYGILADDDTLVVVAAEHPCTEPVDHFTGWYLGTDWARDSRIYQGGSVEDLAVDPGHPFHGTLEYDCAETDAFWVAQMPHPDVFGTMLDGTMTVYERFAPDDDDLDPETGGTRRWAQYVDDAWEVTTVTDVPLARSRAGKTDPDDVFDVGGAPGLLESTTHRSVLVTPRLIVPGPDGEPMLVTAARGLLADELFEAAWVDGGFVIAGTTDPDPFVGTSGSEDDPRRIRVWRSEPGFDPLAGTCVLEPGADCRFADLTTMSGYPEFGGLDLRGIDLSFASLGGADFSGADFEGARLWEVDSDFDASFAGARFDDAEAQGADLGDARGASFVGADLREATLGDVTGADLTDAEFRSANLEFFTWPTITTTDLATVGITVLRDETGQVPFEIDLSGLDLAGARVKAATGAAVDGQLLVVTSLEGSTVERTTFQDVDLSPVDPGTVDLSEMRVWEGSICPDGEPPDDPPIGTCDRSPED